MALINYTTLLFVILALIPFSIQNINDNEVEEEDSNPFLDIASSFLQNSLNNNNGGGASGGAALGALGGIIGSLMQGENGKHLGDMLVGMQGSKSNVAGDVISGLGSLLTNKDGNLDPNILGSMISAFADSTTNNNEKPAKAQPKKKQAQEEGFDMSTLLNIASTFMGQQNQQAQNSPMDFLPLLLNTLSSFNGPEANERAHKHESHSSFLPPVIEKLHIYWDHFINSDLGRAIWENTGLSDMTKYFMDKEGNVDFEIVLKSLENHSFRRRWIKSATTYMTEWIVHLANPEVQQRYLSSGQFMVNGFLKSQGFPKHAHFQPNKIPESISNIINHILIKYLNTPTDVSIYVKPAINYFKELLKSSQSHGSYLRKVDKDELSDKLTDTLNLEIIEPILRVYRAYRFAVKHPQCQTHILCAINRHDPNEKLGLPGFKVGLTKASSFVASAALSYHGGHGFWDLYNAIRDDTNCKAKYPAYCDEFHEEEIKVTTEYYHNEL